MKKIIPIIVVLIIIGGGAFYGGMKYGQKNFQNLSLEKRQQLPQGNVEKSFQKGFEKEVGSGFLNGEVIAKDEQSLTLKMSAGGSKIIFFSDSTQISETAEGSVDDIEIGKQIVVSGEQNPDGSYTAKTIQLSPIYLGR